MSWKNYVRLIEDENVSAADWAAADERPAVDDRYAGDPNSSLRSALHIKLCEAKDPDALFVDSLSSLLLSVLTPGEIKYERNPYAPGFDALIFDGNADPNRWSDMGAGFDDAHYALGESIIDYTRFGNEDEQRRFIDGLVKILLKVTSPEPYEPDAGILLRELVRIDLEIKKLEAVLVNLKHNAFQTLDKMYALNHRLHSEGIDGEGLYVDETNVVMYRGKPYLVEVDVCDCNNVFKVDGQVALFQEGS